MTSQPRTAVPAIQVDGIIITSLEVSNAVQTTFEQVAGAGNYHNGTPQDHSYIDGMAVHGLIDPIAQRELARQEGLPTDEQQLYNDWLTHASSTDRSTAQQHDRDPNFRNQMANAELVIELAQHFVPIPVVSDAELKQYYEQHLAEFARTAPQVHVREISVANITDAQHILDILGRGVPFASLASSSSLDAPFYRQRGGDIGWIGLGGNGSMPPELQSEALSLRQNQISSPFKVGDRYYILQAIDTPDYQPWPFETVRRQVLNDVLTAKMQQSLSLIVSGHEKTMSITVLNSEFAPLLATFRATLVIAPSAHS